LRAWCAVFAGCARIPLVTLGALHALYIPRKGLVAAEASRALKAGSDEIHLAVLFSAGCYDIAGRIGVGAEGDREKKRDYD
jgi:hypothetical protein